MDNEFLSFVYFFMATNTCAYPGTEDKSAS